MTEGKVWPYPDFVRLLNTSTPLRSVELSKKWRKSGFHGQGWTWLSCDALRFLGVAQTIVRSRLCYGVGFVQCLFIFCITSFGDCTRPQHQTTVWKVEIILRKFWPEFEVSNRQTLSNFVEKKYQSGSWFREALLGVLAFYFIKA